MNENNLLCHGANILRNVNGLFHLTIKLQRFISVISVVIYRWAMYLHVIYVNVQPIVKLSISYVFYFKYGNASFWCEKSLAILKDSDKINITLFTNKNVSCKLQNSRNFTTAMPRCKCFSFNQIEHHLCFLLSILTRYYLFGLKILFECLWRIWKPSAIFFVFQRSAISDMKKTNKPFASSQVVWRQVAIKND